MGHTGRARTCFHTKHVQGALLCKADKAAHRCPGGSQGSGAGPAPVLSPGGGVAPGELCPHLWSHFGRAKDKGAKAPGGLLWPAGQAAATATSDLRHGGAAGGGEGSTDGGRAGQKRFPVSAHERQPAQGARGCLSPASPCLHLPQGCCSPTCHQTAEPGALAQRVPCPARHQAYPPEQRCHRGHLGATSHQPGQR